MHPIIALLLLHRMLTQMRQAKQSPAVSMPSLGTVARTTQPAAKPARKPRVSATAKAQGHHGLGQAFQGEKGPMAAARTRPTQQSGTQPGQIPSLSALLGLLNGGSR